MVEVERAGRLQAGATITWSRCAACSVTRIETTQIYAQIQTRQLKQAVSFYEGKALDMLG